MSAHKAREERAMRLRGEASERAKLLAIGAALLLSRSNSGDPRLPEDRMIAIRAVSDLLDDAEVFALEELALAGEGR